MDQSRPEENEAVDSSELLLQLREKLKTQAQRIRSLESYKVLCEERLTELFPSHPLPVLPEHIGSGGVSASQELLNCRQKIAKLEQQVSQTSELVPGPSSSVTYNKLHELYTLLHQKYNSMLKEKSELEDSLRNEVLASEEQRAYIEVLKQAIEVKTESLGLSGIKPNEFAEYSHMRISTEESRRESNKLTVKISDYEAQIKSLMESMKTKHEECKDLIFERDELTDQLHQAAEALQYAEEEVQKLEEEKNNLIDYVDTQNKIEHSLRNEIKELLGKLNFVQDEGRKKDRNIGEISEENRKIILELEGVKSENFRNEKTLKETQQSLANLKARVEEKEQSLQKYKEEHNSMLIQNSSLQAINEAIGESLTRAEETSRLNKSDLDQTRIEEDRARETISQLRGHSQQLQEEKGKFEKKYLEADCTVQELTAQLKVTTEKAKSLESVLASTSADLESLTKLYQSLQDSEETHLQTISESKRHSSHIQTELESLLKQYQNSQQELLSTTENYEQGRIKIKSLNSENNANHLKILELNTLLESERSAFRRLEEENNYLVQRIQKLENELEVNTETLLCREQECSNYQKDLENLTHIVSQGQNEIIEEKYQIAQKDKEVSMAKLEIERVQKENVQLKEAYEAACRPAQCFSSMLSVRNSAKFKEIALNFIDHGNYNLDKWVEAATKELQELTSKLSESLQLSDSLQHKNQLLSQDLDLKSQEQTGFKSKELMLKSQIENSSQEVSYLRESLRSQVNSLQQEILTLRNTLQNVYEDIENLENKNRSLSSEIVQLRNRLEYSENSSTSLEKKIKIFASEKLHLESLLNNYKADRTTNGTYRSN